MASSSDSETTQQRAGFPTAVRDAFRNRGFTACVILLAAFAGTFHALARMFEVQFEKLPIELRKPLAELDKSKLYPYEFIRQYSIKPEVIDSLGTDKYIQWLLQDTRITDDNRPEKYVNLFVTYYTGGHDKVPHVPEQCYSASGAQVGGGYTVDIDVPGLAEPVKAQVLEIKSAGLLTQDTKIVVYLFSANGEFCVDRRQVQMVMARPMTRYGYYSKLEVTFGSQTVNPNKNDAIAAAKKFLAVIIPVLMEEHWPDWKAVEAAAQTQAAD